ncbi:IclR family transcriptional regulator [Microbacterium sp. RD1]|uniref:IclR family transcriptional regulator n=1 Tax=Microbacterium sp. RD1 TaxID=3457313 RepID=UPI003FA5930F
MHGIERSLRTLELIADLQPVGVTELAKRLGVPKSTMQRTLVALAAAEWIQEDPAGYTRWRLAPVALRIGQRVLGAGDLRTVAMEPLRLLRDESGESASLQVRDGLVQTVQIERVESLQAVRTFIDIGSVTPITMTSGGLSILAALPDVQVDEVLSAPIEQRTPDTVTDPAALRKMIAEVREKGYAVNLGQNRAGVRGVGAAVLDSRGAPVAGVGISVPEGRFDPERIPEWGAQVTTAARRIAALL